MTSTGADTLQAVALTQLGAGEASEPAGPDALLALFHRAGVLGLADVHTARGLARIGREPEPTVALAVALTVRALRMGSVCIDLSRVHSEVFDESETQLDVSALPWPDPGAWRLAVRASPLVADGAERPSGRPLRWAHGLLYLERYWQQEEQVRLQLDCRAERPPPAVDARRVAAALERLFTGDGLAPDEPDRQKLAAAVCALRSVTVLAGGPGTGKTTTVARLLALLRDQPGPALRVALAAPTGKAAARLAEAISSAAAELPAADADRLGELSASTLHRLLGWLPESRSRFRHDARHHLPYDVVVVDEMSMVSLTLMARLLEAVRPDARLILVGDPDQLSSVEAGAVLADVAGAVGGADPRLADRLADVGVTVSADQPATERGVVRLTHTWRFGGAIEALARAIRDADTEGVVRVLRSGAHDVWFSGTDVDESAAAGLGDLVEQVRQAAELTRSAAERGDVPGALSGLDRHRLLCAHRRGPYGVSRWAVEVERWLAAGVGGPVDGDDEWYPGRPLLVTSNDYELNLYNGDTGVVVRTPAGLRAAFARGRRHLLVAPVRLEAVQTVHAMTVHRSQGSQFRCVSFVLPPASSPLLTRELLYTAVTRATQRVQVFGTEESVRRAVGRPANRASGLRTRLG